MAINQVRRDAEKAKRIFQKKGEEYVRVPISCLLKLALAEVVGSQPHAPAAFRETALGLMPHFLNDNTSPETHSFHIVPLSREEGLGQALAEFETLWQTHVPIEEPLPARDFLRLGRD